jgi:hypothetical protein
MSVRQIDEALGLWKVRVSSAAQNLLDLLSHPVYKRISEPDANLTGETARQSVLAVKTCGSLMQRCDLLQNAISRAEELRQDMPSVFGADEREREIVAVLQGRSIRLPTVQVPLGQRGLSTDTESAGAISPADLLTSMESSFEDVKQIVLQLNAAWEALGISIGQAAQKLTDLEGQRQYLSTGDRVELAEVARQLQTLQQLATEDPLGSASQLLTSINETLTRVGTKIEEARKKTEQVRVGLTSARALLSTLKSEHEVARSTHREALEKAGCRLDFSENDKKLEGLIAWFDRLSAASGDGMLGGSAPAAMLVGLSNWSSAAHQILAADQAAAAEATQLLSTRLELRGRLEALKAKARAYSLAEHDELVALADQAAALLYRRPTPIDEAAALVAAYEVRLNNRVKNSV